jgi:SAM-dependent methyltransferase
MRAAPALDAHREKKVNTYEFVSSWVTQQLAGRPGRVLDYGCGAGQIIKQLRTAGVDAWGCDVFYEGGDYSTQIPAELQPFIRRITVAAIPYEDSRFDIVLSNQVFEHVPDMDEALREIARVLKPGGTALNVFPDRGVWREGHCGIPFLHWFPKGTKLRVYYAACLRSLGLGNFTEGKSIMHWSRDFCDWLDKWTYYRTRDDIHERFNRVIGETTHAEEQWLRARFNGRFDAMPTELQRFIVRKMAGLTLVSVKAAH